MIQRTQHAILPLLLLLSCHCVTAFVVPLAAQPRRLSPLLYTTKTDLSDKNSNDNASTSQESSSSTSSNNWHSYVSSESDADESLAGILSNLDLDKKSPPHVAFLFVSQFHASKFESLVKQASMALTSECRLMSVVGSGVIGDDCEMDEPSKPSMSLLVGYNLPNKADSIELFDFNELHNPPPEVGSEYWNHLAGNTGSSSSSGAGASVLIFADPWSPVEKVMAGLGSNAVVAGGVSVPTGVGPTVAKDDQPLPQGSLVGARFKDNLKLLVVTAQGCRPVNDQSFIITAAEGSCILELDSQPALTVLEKVVSSIMDPNEQKIVSSGLVCGIQACDSMTVIKKNDDDDDDEEEHESYGEVLESDDYLIRQILGFVPTKGGLIVAGAVHAGERLRFHVRDRKAAEQDLELMMKRVQTERSVFGNKGEELVCALQISCVARGRSLFGNSNVDLKQTKSLLGPGDGPVAGFYANGEIGPVGIAGFTNTAKGNNISPSHIHGFTTVVAYICDTSSVLKEKESESLMPSSPLVDEPAAWG